MADNYENTIRRNTGYYKCVPWWTRLRGSVVMVMTDVDVWEPDVLFDYNPSEYRKFVCATGLYTFARPLTQVEKDAIITEG